ncbi:MAG: hypothetical protein KBD78_12065 [Oligoflexales bacterium]|nr:hypothetical protein [Oligoflexales bacterium]
MEKLIPENDLGFDVDLVKKYPKSAKKMTIQVAPYSLRLHTTNELKEVVNTSLTTFISPYGVEFQTPQDYPEGTLLKIELSIPDYWIRKKSLVSYNRIDAPNSFALLAKVISKTEVGKRGKKKSIVAQTVNIDEIDIEVLKTYLQEG